VSERPSQWPREARQRRRELLSCAALLLGVVGAGVGARSIGLDTGTPAVAVAATAVGVFAGVALRKALLRR